ncbi:MAG: hypothetical protein ACON3Z_12940 [Bradymonadia bacterium]
MYKKATFVSMGCVLLVACSEDSTAPKIQCGPGTALNAASNTCEPRLTDNVVISDEGELVIKTERLDEVREAARRAGFDEGAASITPLQCTENTELNAAGDSCKPTQAFRDEAFTEGRIDGISSVTPLNCADGTAVNADGNACEPTADYRAAAVEEGRVAGVASVTPLVCDDGTLVNESDDACIPNLSVNVVVDADGLVVPSPEFGSRVCANAGGNFEPETGACSPSNVSYVCFRGGFCSEAARLGLEVDPALVDANPVEVGCHNTQEGNESWSVGTELAFRSTAALDPGGPEWRSFALRLWLCR